MTENEFDDELDLLIPEDIPVAPSLNVETAKKLTKVFSMFLQALKKTNPSDALGEINCALENLGEVETTSAEVNNTKTSLKNREVQDYDRYFKVNRIQTQEPEIVLTKGLLTNTKTFLLLCQQCGDSLEDRQIKMQKQGFIIYAQLLVRNFGLNIPDT